MTAITEGNLTFTFIDVPDHNGRVTKYDDWSFYRNQFNSAFGGTKAVDLIYVSDNKTWLIEVKDYRLHSRTKTVDIGDEIAAKVRDTLAGLVSAKFNANEPVERTFAASALASNKLRIVLHLEQPQKQSRLFPQAIDPSKVLQKLKQRLKAVDAHPVVVDQYHLRPDMNWTVQRIDNQ